ncbi:MAG TPA: DNA recombination protein RmuC [Bdellovibrionota bacterium]|nr:DNA recombination protein RmuC [Bdellovibrionota bacterium]
MHYELVGLLILMVLQFLWLRFQFKARGDSSESFQKSLMELSERLTERMTRINIEMRDVVAERLSKHFAETQERTDRTLAQNRQEMQSGLFKTTQALETKFQSLELQVGTRLETIGKNVETKLNENLKEGFKHFEKVQEHLQAAELKLASLNTVGQSISELNNLLKLPHLRGGFGEATLERLLADFLPSGAYELQYQIAGSTERVDAVVKLSRQILPIDSKFPREQVLPLFENSQDPAVLEQARRLLSDFVKTQAKSIATKYIRPDCGTTDMALLFLPSETLYFEVIRNGELFEAISKLKVFPVSPNTLSISLHAIAIAQEYYEMARGVEKTIEDVKKARRHFEHFEKKFDEIGKGLRKAQEAFETAHTHLGHYETSVFRLVGETQDTMEPTALPAPPAPGDA